VLAAAAGGAEAAASVAPAPVPARAAAACRAHEVVVPTVTTTGIARIVVFLAPGLFASFGLPRECGLTPAAISAALAGLSL